MERDEPTMSTPPESNREKELFSAALDLPAADRAVFLQRECAGDMALRQRIEELLRAHGGADEIFPTEPDELTEIVTLSEGPGTVIGKYKLLEQIGEGGMGVVYMAEQSVPFNKRVALKIIKLGMDTKGVVARFEAERQALALMNHPNIAKVLDAGATDTGRPYFVMELVRGMPITEYCDQQKLSTRQRLELFIPVCQAIQHAHQKGIIHRDIKPSNVMVALFDDKPVPMVIDFGIAKATHQRLTEKTLFTRHGQFIGTLEYIAPEQARGSQIDIDTRADVYSLGVLLYQLLTGSTPFPHLREQAWEESMRIIREEEPPRPSTRLSTLTAVQLTGITTTHGGEPPHKISLVLRRELDWIVMACLEKDRSRRYETANGLALDIARYLRGDAPEKAPPSVWYQFSKLARKHKKTCAMAAAIAVILAVATVFSAWQAIRAKKAEQLAGRRAEETLQQKAATDSINGWMRREVLGLLDAWGAEGAPRRADVLLRDVLVQSTTNLSAQFKDQPVIEAEIRYSIGQSLRSMEANAAAELNLRRSYELFREHLGPTHADTIVAEIWLGWLLAWRSREYDPGDKVFNEAVKLMEDGYHAAIRDLGDRSEASVFAASLLGIAHINHGNLEPAAQWAPKAPAILGPLPAPPDSPYSGHAWHAAYWTMALLRGYQGAQAERVKILEQLWENDTKPRGTAAGLRPSALLARLHGEMAEIEWGWRRNSARAEVLFTNGLAMSQQVVGAGHPTDNIAHSTRNFYFDLDRFDDAAKLIQSGLALAVPQLGIDHHFCWQLRFHSVNPFGLQGDWQGALDEYQRQRNAGQADRYIAAGEVLALHLLGRPEAYREMCQQFWQRYNADPTNCLTSYRFARTMLALPCPPEELSSLARMIDLAVAELGSDATLSVGRKFLNGLLAYRRGDMEATTNDLQQVGHPSPFFAINQPLAAYVLAMAQDRLGHHEESVRTLAGANHWLDAHIRRGKLAAQKWRWQGWDEFGSLIAVRQEAEQLIHGHTVSPPVTKEVMAANRKAWAPIQKLLDDGDWAARQHDCQKAAALYRQAREHKYFSMEAAQYDANAFDKMLFAHVMLNDVETCAKLWPMLYPDGGPVPEETLRLLLPLANALPASLQAVMDKSMAALGLEQKWEQDSTKRPKGNELTLGLHWIRRGEFARAVEPLEILSKDINVNRAALGTAYLALAQHQSGNKEIARQLFETAKASYHEHWVKHSPQLYQPDWIAAAMVEQAVKEAGQVIAPEKKAGP